MEQQFGVTNIAPEHLRVIERLADALQKLTSTASQHLGADCMLHAALAQRILAEQGIKTRLVIGEAAWRVGPNDGDVITHSPRTGGVAPPGVDAVAYHAWLAMGDVVIDFTTHSLTLKAAQLDALDGGQTTVLWCPRYLVLAHNLFTSIHDVTQALEAGVCVYQELPGLTAHLVKRGLIQEVDEEDLDVLRLLFNNPELQVFGPAVCC
jgi:hypothetical protein